MHYLFGEPARYLDPFTSFGFIRFFATEKNKDILIDFLNSLLELEFPIIDLSIKTRKFCLIFDIFCTCQNGESLIVEIQRESRNYFGKIDQFYDRFPIKEEISKDKLDYESKPIYLLGMLDFIFSENERKNPNQYKSTVKINDQVTCIYLEMPKFNKTESELQTNEDKWLYVLKNLADFQDRPKQLKEKIFKKFLTLAELSKLSYEESQYYEASLKNYRDNINVYDTAVNNGFIKGVRMGVIERLKSNGMNMENIAKVFDTTPEKIQMYLSE